MNSRAIRFDFAPASAKGHPFYVEKEDENGGGKRRLLYGISSGSKLDGMGERMTEKCVQSFQEQAAKAEILLYADLHGIRQTEDIGRLVRSWVDEAGDWHTEYQLYDEKSGAEPYQIQIANTLWKQINGIHPYAKPMERGFSIEGIIPEGAIKSMDESGRRIIDEVQLDGVVCVKRPAYTPSIAQAVSKSLGEATRQTAATKKAIKSIQDSIKEKDTRADYWEAKWKLFDALEEQIDEVMKSADADKKTPLTAIFDEFRNLFIPLILSHSIVFEEDKDAAVKSQVEKDRDVLRKTMVDQFRALVRSFQKPKGKS